MDKNTNLINYNKNTGFTLLEILIVIIIVTLISGLLIQGLSQTLLIQKKQQQSLLTLERAMMVNQWFVQSTRGLFVTYSKPDFIGKRDQFTGISLQALNTGNGIPTLITWAIRSDDQGQQLTYNENETNGANNFWLIHQWYTEITNQAEIHFEYRDRQGQWHERWPPEQGHRFERQAIEVRFLLPVAIKITSPEIDDFPFFVTITNNRLPKMDFRELL